MSDLSGTLTIDWRKWRRQKKLPDDFSLASGDRKTNGKSLL